MPDGDIARSRVGDLPVCVADCTREPDKDVKWPGGDVGKPPDATPDSQPLIDLKRFGPNESPLSPDVRELTERLKESRLVSTVIDLLSALALLGNLL